MTYVTVNTDVDVYLDEFDTDDLIEELESRGHTVLKAVSTFGQSESEIKLFEQLYQKRRTNQDYTKELDQLIYNCIGRM